jgi:hypothetical protein
MAIIQTLWHGIMKLAKKGNYWQLNGFGIRVSTYYMLTGNILTTK